MRRDLRFRRLEDIADPVTLEIDGREVVASRQESVAAAMLAEGILSFRATPVGAAERGPFCLMGSCFDCLVEIDGQANCQACMVSVSPGMRVRRMDGPRRISKTLVDDRDG